MQSTFLLSHESLPFSVSYMWLDSLLSMSAQRSVTAYTLWLVLRRYKITAVVNLTEAKTAVADTATT